MSRPLLVLSCSADKRAVDPAAFVPFSDLYDGPMWRQVRAIGFPVARVCAISALYGFLEPGRIIQTYDRVMDEKRSARMCGEGADVYRFAEAVKVAGGAFVVGGALYQELARRAIAREPELAELVTFARGSYLQQRKQLGEWLRAQTGDILAKGTPVGHAPAIDATPAGPQHVLPGAERVSSACIAKQMAAAPLKPNKPQAQCDLGLFSDERNQLDLF